MQSVVREPACACVGSVDVLIRVHDNRLLSSLEAFFCLLQYMSTNVRHFFSQPSGKLIELFTSSWRGGRGPW